MQILRLCATREYSPRILEHWLCTQQKNRKPLHFFIYESQGKVQMACSEDLSTQFEGSSTETTVTPKFTPQFWLKQSNGSLLPFKRHSQFEDRVNKTRIYPMDGLVRAMIQTPGSALQIKIHSIPNRQRRRALKKAKKAWFQTERRFDQWESQKWFQWSFRNLYGPLLRKFLSMPKPSLLDEQTESLHEREDPQRATLDKLSRPLFKVQVAMTHPFTEFVHGFNLPYLGVLQIHPKKQKLILSAEELASLMSFPNPIQCAPFLETESCAYLPPPKNPPFPLAREDRQRHLYLIGKTGMGKSSALLHFLEQDLQSRDALMVLDPHGDLLDHALTLIPPERQKDLLHIQMENTDFPIALNPLECKEGNNPALISSALLEMFCTLAKGSWGPRLEYILRNALLTLTQASNTTLLDLPRLLTDPEKAQTLLTQIQDLELKRFWREEFFALDKRTRDEFAAPILNKVGPLLTSPLLRNVFGQPKNKIQIHDWMREGKIIFVSLSKGQLGEDVSRMLGMIFLSLTYFSLIKQSRLPPHERAPLKLTIDEFQNLATPTLASMLSECRKYGLSLTLANQHISQLPPPIQDAVLGNVGSFIVFRTHVQDAECLAPVLGLLPEDLTHLAPYQSYAKVLKNGAPLPTFRSQFPAHQAKFPAPPPSHQIKTQKILGRPKAQVEEKLRKRYNGNTKKPTA